eukprot:TRINITY_DN15582_c0_g1_i1.p1 TRINITY_DN15582_c0_g1~~TRINITY_DN15582_c0_g1_i1.p1  ORF type:complete len:159 (-),score=13.36 TRINITY_DN15582_c0_g1_i1:214-690(-)
MLMPTEDRKQIFMYLFKEGVMVAKKDQFAPRHPQVPVKNIFVMKAMQSLTSRGYVRTQFNWDHYYYFLTQEGVEYLRGFLHIPETVVPSTFKRPTKTMDARRGGDDRGGEYRKRPMGDRDDYRRRDGDWGRDWSAKKEGAGADYNPEFRGAGRGARRE